jgi:MFS family permease
MTKQPAHDPPAKVAPRPEAVIWILCVVGVVSALQSTLLIPLVSRLPEIYDVGAVPASWIVTSTLLASAVATPILTRLAEIYGKRRIVVVTLAAMAIGSLLLAVTQDYALALFGRSLQGFGAALIPVAMSIMKDALPAHRVGFGIALLSATLGMGTALGLPLAGVLYGLFGFSSLFWMTAIAASCLAVLIQRMLPETARGSRERFDWGGALLLTVALTALLLVITQGNEWGWLSPGIVGAGLASIVAFAAFLPWEQRLSHPLVHVQLLALRPVALTNIAAIVIAMAMIINLYLASIQLAVPRQVAGGLGLDPDLAGLLTGIPAGVLAAVSPGVGALLNRIGGRRVFVLGAMIMGSSYVARVWLDDSPFEICLGAVLVCIGTSLAISSTPLIIMASVPPENTASANGVHALCRMIGTSLSLAALAAITASTSTTFDGVEYPTTTTYHVAFWGCALLTGVAAFTVLFVPETHRLATVRRPVSETSMTEQLDDQIEPVTGPGPDATGTLSTTHPAPIRTTQGD